MPFLSINGIEVAYELVGTGKCAVTITPGGRFSRQTPGVRELAEALAARGYRVLIWDRPNCGESQVCFDGECESFQNADTLAGLIRILKLGPALVYGASGGSRETLLTAVRHPDCVAGVVCQWLSGGGIGVAALPTAYCANSVIAASLGGMAAVLELPDWREQLARNSSNRARFLAWDAKRFARRLRDWADWFLPQPGMPIPCIKAGDLESIRAPALILRSSESDMHHTRETSERVASMIPGARLQEPPWGEDEWIEQMRDDAQHHTGLFRSMPALVPQLGEFAASISHV
jgi:pimeloyl-ACP methyl ester carboxylesterase